jgi:hypothetical protein
MNTAKSLSPLTPEWNDECRFRSSSTARASIAGHALVGVEPPNDVCAMTATTSTVATVTMGA